MNKQVNLLTPTKNRDIFNSRILTSLFDTINNCVRFVKISKNVGRSYCSNYFLPIFIPTIVAASNVMSIVCCIFSFSRLKSVQK